MIEIPAAPNHHGPAFLHIDGKLEHFQQKWEPVLR